MSSYERTADQPDHVPSTEISNNRMTQYLGNTGGGGGGGGGGGKERL